MTTLLDLGLVADRFCPTSRTYLSYLALAGYRVKRVLLVDFVPGWIDPGWLGLRSVSWRASRRKQATKLPVRQYDDQFKELCAALQADFPVQVDYFGAFDFAQIAQSLEHITVTSYEDVDLARRLTRGDIGTWLYTDGGRVGDNLLSHPSFKMLHIHPGVVPWVKGSDGMLWSTLVRGRPGMSCFYMNAGIDTGDIIATREFELPRLSRLRDLRGVPLDLLYRALLHAYDPHLRASTLLEVVQGHSRGELSRLPCRPQSPEEGRTFFWMHEALKRVAVRRLLGLHE